MAFGREDTFYFNLDILPLAVFVQLLLSFCQKICYIHTNAVESSGVCKVLSLTVSVFILCRHRWIAFLWTQALMAYRRWWCPSRAAVMPFCSAPGIRSSSLQPREGRALPRAGEQPNCTWWMKRFSCMWLSQGGTTTPAFREGMLLPVLVKPADLLCAAGSLWLSPPAPMNSPLYHRVEYCCFPWVPLFSPWVGQREIAKAVYWGGLYWRTKTGKTVTFISRERGVGSLGTCLMVGRVVNERLRQGQLIWIPRITIWICSLFVLFFFFFQVR